MNDESIEAVREALDRKQTIAGDALKEPWLIASMCDPRYVVQSHHRVMSAALKEWAETPNGRLGISTPPRTGKSWLAIVWTTFWLLARFPDSEIIIACCTQKLVDKHSRDIKDRLQRFGHLFGLKLVKASGGEFVLSSGGSVLMVGLGGMATGFGADFMLIDDAFRDYKEALSPTARESKWLWLSSVAQTRLYPGGRLMHTGTRWNPDDLEGRLRRSDPDWKSIRIPAIADAPDDPLGRAIGDPMPVPQFDETNTDGLRRHWERIKVRQPFVIWECMYQGQETPGGKPLVSPDILTEREYLATDVRVLRRAISIDPSVGKRSATGSIDADNIRQNTCGIIAGFLGVDARVYLTHDATAVMTIEEWAVKGMLLAFTTKASVVFVEDNQGGEFTRITLTGTWNALRKKGKVAGACPRIVTYHAVLSKEVRADNLASRIETDKVRTAANLTDYYNELLTWRPGLDSPGRIDAAGALAEQLLPDDELDGVFDGELIAAAVAPATPSDVELPDYEEDDE